MNSLFYCITLRNKRCSLEPRWTLLFHSGKHIIFFFIFLNVLAGISSILSFYELRYLIKSGQSFCENAWWIYYLGLAVISSLMANLRPRMSAIAEYKYYKKAGGGVIPSSRDIFYETFLIHLSSLNKQETRILYSDVDAIWETANYYMLHPRNEGSCIILDKSGFVGICHEEAYKFLLSKSGKA